jgi:hypothetical protein
MKKFLIIVVLLAALGGGGFYAYTMFFKSTESTDAINLVPDDAIFFLEAQSPIRNWQKFSNSDLWKFLKMHPTLAEVTDDADYLDKMISDNQLLFSAFGDRTFFMSAHMTKPTDYDFLFIVDLRDAAKFDLMDVAIKNMVSERDYTVTERDFEGYNIIQLFDKKAKDNLYLAQVKNFLVCSYTAKLVENSIIKEAEAPLANDAKYKEVYQRVGNDGIGRLYLQYDLIDDYLKVYTTGNESTMKTISESFSYTGLDMKLEDEEALMTGYTSLPDSADVYTKLIQEYGNAEYGFHNILSSRIAYAQVIALNKFKEFYKKVIEMQSRDPQSLKEYNEMKRTVEKVLGLSLEDDILSWIGNEVVLAQNVPSKLHHNEDDLVVAIKAYNVDYAKEKLLMVQKKIKRRTPAKFKKMSYKSHEIYYLDIKGFFSVFFGKSFGKITKPYYTIIDEYVVFSNSPKTLVALLEDYENGNVVGNMESFKRLQKNIPEKVALFTYVNGETTYDVMGKNVKAAEKANYAKNKKYFNFFKSVGVAYTASGDGFDNNIYILYSDDYEEPMIAELEIDSISNKYFEDYTETLKNMSEAEVFVLNEVNDGEFVKYFSGTEIVQLKAETKNGQLHGDFMEFYPNGSVRSEGKYRKSKKVGRWKYYNTEGVLEEKDWEGL